MTWQPTPNVSASCLVTEKRKDRTVNLASILAVLRSMPKVELGKYSQFLALAIPLLPEKAKVRGKMVNLRATLAAAVSDGDLDADDALAFVLAWVSGEQPALPPTVKPVPVPPPADPTPPVPAGRLWPWSLAIEVHSLSHQGDDIPFVLERSDNGEHLQVERTDGVDSITGHTKLYLGVGYYDDGGKPINFEERGCLYLYNTARWSVVSENGRGSDELWSLTPGALPGEGQMMKTENGVANFPLGEATRTGLMDVVVNIPEPPTSAPRPQNLRIAVEVMTPTGTVRSVALRLPPLR